MIHRLSLLPTASSPKRRTDYRGLPLHLRLPPRRRRRVDHTISSTPNLAGLLQTYPATAKVAEDHKIFFTTFSSSALENMLNDGYQAPENMSANNIKACSKRIYDIAVLFANGQPLHTTPQGLPSLWCPHDSAIDIMEFAMVVSMRGFVVCDHANVEIWADVNDDQRLVPWAKTMVVFIEHFFTHGHREAPTALSLEFSKEEHSPRNPTMLAKRRHGLSLFNVAVLNMEVWRAGSNATIHTRATNFMFSNYRGSVLATIAYDGRPMSARWARNFAAVGALDGYDVESIEPLPANLERRQIRPFERRFYRRFEAIWWRSGRLDVVVVRVEGSSRWAAAAVGGVSVGGWPELAGGSSRRACRRVDADSWNDRLPQTPAMYGTFAS